MTIAKNSMLTKVATGFVAFTAGLLMLGLAQPAAAQSNAELEAQIQSLLETIANLQAQVGGSAGVSGTCPASIFSLSAGQGATGAAVKDLQVFLNMNADTRVAASGPGSPGNETSYYGGLTANAVSTFQTKYSADILAPLGLASATGYWGPSSSAKAQSLCASMADDSDDSDDSDDDSDDSSSDDLKGGEASLEDFDMNTGDDSDIEEGRSGDIAEFDFDVENGDVRVSRIDLSFTAAAGNDEKDPWDAFDEITLYHDGNEIASADVDRKSDWLSDDSPYKWRFSGLNTVVREGNNAEFTVEIKAQKNVVTTTDTWNVYVHGDSNTGGIRAIDGEGINHYIGDTNDKVSFDIDPEGEGDDLDVRHSSNNPDASTIEVNADKRAGWFDIFVFELDASDSDNDIVLDTVPVTINITNGGNGTSTIDDVVRKLELVIDGETFTDYTITDKTATTSTIVTFDIDENYTLDAGDKVDVSLGVEFKARDGNYTNGQQIRASVTSTDDGNADAGDIKGEGADDVVAAGTVTGKWHTLLAEGIFAYDASTSTSVSGQNDTVGTFKIFFTLEAFEDDFHFSATSSDISYTVNGGTATTSAVLSDLSDANEGDVHAGHYTVYRGESEKFEFSVTVDPVSTGQYNVQLNSIDYGTSAATSSTYTFSPASDYKTNNQTIQGS